MNRIIRVLIIKDRQSDTTLLERELSTAELESNCKRVETTEQLRHALNDEKWDLIIAAHPLPGIVKSEALKIAQEIAPGIPFIIIAENKNDEIPAEHDQDAPGDIILITELDQLNNTLKRALDTGILRSELRQNDDHSRDNDRLASEEECQDTKNRLLEMFEFAPVGFMIVDRSGIIREINQASIKLLRRNKTTTLGKHLRIFLTADSVVSYDTFFNNIIDDRARAAIELKLITPLGNIDVQLNGVLTNYKRNGYSDIHISMMDITKRKQNEQALAISEERFRKIFEYGPLGIGVADLELRVVRGNPALCSMLGYTEDEITQLSLSQIVHPDDLPENLDRMGQFSSNKIPNFTTMVRCSRKDGRMIWMNVTVTFILDEKGNPLYSLSMLENINERKLIEERFRDIVLSSNDWAWEVDPQGRYIYVSDNIKIVMGYEPQEILGKTPFDLMAPQEAAIISKAFIDIVKAQKPIKDLENWNISKDGQRVCLLTNGVPIIGADGEFQGYRGVDKDITKRKKADEALLESEEFNRAISEYSPLGVSVRSRTGKLLSCNAAWQKIWNKTNDEIQALLATEPTELKFNERDNYLKDWHSKIRDIYQSGGYLHIPEAKLLYHYQGGEHWVSQHFYAIKNENGQVEKVVILTEDITERKRGEDKLKQSERRLSLIVENAGDIIFTIALVDGRYRFETVNHSFEKTTGLSKSLVEGKYVDEVIPEPSLSMVLGNYAKAIREREIVNWEEVSDYPNGRLTGIVTVAPILNEKGECTQLVGTVHDITERKRAEEALENELIRRRIFVEGSRDGIVVLDEKGGVCEANPKYAEMLKYTLDEVMQLHVWDWDFQWSREQLLEMIRKVDSAGDHFETKHKRKDGSLIDVEISSNGVVIAGQKLVFCVCRDISERKQMETELRESRRMLQVVLNSIPARVFWKDKNLLYLGCNTSFAQDAGFEKPEDIIGKDDHAMGWRDQAESYMVDDRKVIESGNPRLHIEEPQTTPSGEQISLLTSKVPLRDADGTIVGVLGTYLDITDRKRAEEALRESEAKYRSVVENMQDVFYRTDIDGNLIMISPSGPQFLGYDSIDQLLNVNIAKVLYVIPEDRAKFMQQLQSKGFVRNYEVILKRIDGNAFYATTSSQFYYDANGKVLGVEGILHDVNENKINQEALRISEERYRLLIENAGEAIFVIQDFKIGFSNRRLSEILGYTPGYIIDKNFADYIHPEDKEAVLRRFMARVEGSAVDKAVPFRVLANGGGYKWLEVDAVKIIWDGRPATLNFATDVTERILAQDNLKESEVKFRTIFENSADASFLGKDCFLDCNQKAIELFGCQQNELIGRTPLDFSPDSQPDGNNSQSKMVEYINAALAGSPQNFYWQHRKKNGTLIDTEVSIKALTLNDNLVLHGVIRDISQRKRSEDTLRRLATAVEQSAEGIVILDTDGVIQYVNPAYEKITGRQRDEVVGSMLQILQVQEKDSKQIDEILGKLTTGRTWFGTIEEHKKDGTPFTEEITISPVFDSSGKIINYVAVKRDITKQVTLEQQLFQSQKMEAIGRLAGGVAHDFNNLLTAIMGYSEILRNSLKGQDALMSDVEEIRKAGERAASLTRQLLAFSRKQIIQPRVLNLNSIVIDMNKMLRRLIGENIELVIEADKSLWPTKSDPGQIEQIVMNLTVNGRDAMSKSGKLIIKTENAVKEKLPDAVRIKLGPGEYVMLSVTDNGSGIPDDIMEHIFEPFFTTKEQGKGTGLGLSTVYGIVEQNKGVIDVESKMGVGTTFRILLPRFADDFNQTRTIEFSEGALHGNEIVLVVEDEEIVRNLTRRLLIDLGYKVLVASDPLEAIEICKVRECEIQLMLTDVVMPNMGGDELAVHIKELVPDIKVIFMSGYADSAFVQHEVLESQADFLQKPFNKNGLGMKLREVLDRQAPQALNHKNNTESLSK
jgi:two-component system, cell cycle sensor histidine kinase and response regulator CckA